MPFLLSKNFSFRYLAILVSILFLQGVSAQEISSRSSAAKKELDRRQALVHEGQLLLIKGDEAYKAGDYELAAISYAGARANFPNSPATSELLKAATQRYATASVEQARLILQKGDNAKAKVILDRVLQEEVDPSHSGAKLLLNQLNDPIRTNPAQTLEHAENVKEVVRLLNTAEGAFNLGKFDEANKHYKDVLRIDRYNTAARRGMEQVLVRKAKPYQGSIFDQNRAETIMEVESNWELPLQTGGIIPNAPLDSGALTAVNFVPVSNKLSRIIIPRFDIQDATLIEAIDLLRLRASENDNLVSDPSEKGINITIDLGDTTVSPGKEILEKTFSLRLSNVPVETILGYITESTRTTFRSDDYAVKITRAGSASDELITKTYRVTPDFISSLSTGPKASPQEDDIFNTAPSGGGLLTRRLGAQEALSQQGINFPAGALAHFNPSTNILRVINTRNNQDIIEQIIDSIIQTEPILVSVTVTMLKVDQQVLKELNFDWMLNNFQVGDGGSQSGLFLGGGTTGNGSSNINVPFVSNALTATNPITAGNRSGDSAANLFTLDNLLAAGSSRESQVINRAPGVIGVNGVVGSGVIQMLIRGLDQDKGTDMICRPAMTIRNRQAASIAITRSFIYPTEYEPPQLPQSIGTASSGSIPVTPAFPTSFETRDVGIELEVLPEVDANRRYINIKLNPSVSDFEGFVNYGSPINTTTGAVTTVLAENQILMPVFSNKSVNTNVVVADGATIVIGGLLKEEVNTVNDKTPILGDIPIVGRLFQSNVSEHTSTAILFFVNVELVDPTGRPYRDR